MKFISMLHLNRIFLLVFCLVGLEVGEEKTGRVGQIFFQVRKTKQDQRQHILILEYNFLLAVHSTIRPKDQPDPPNPSDSPGIQDSPGQTASYVQPGKITKLSREMI